MEEAIKVGWKIKIDKMEMLEYLGHAHPDLKICIRMNPHVMAGGNRKISVGHIDSKFGISIHQMPLVHRIIQNHDIHVEGLHMHTGSDILEDRKSTRLNSSHVAISYAGFCLKNKTTSINAP